MGLLFEIAEILRNWREDRGATPEKVIALAAAKTKIKENGGRKDGKGNEERKGNKTTGTSERH